MLRDEILKGWKNLGITVSVPMLDGVVNCAGIIFPFPVKFITEKHISSVFRINFDAQVILNSMLLAFKKDNLLLTSKFVLS